MEHFVEVTVIDSNSIRPQQKTKMTIAASQILYVVESNSTNPKIKSHIAILLHKEIKHVVDCVDSYESVVKKLKNKGAKNGIKRKN